ncbi:MAG: Maf family nucleotide pyrophosphatase [Bacteroidota bacterium]|nr:Maf family nucleotide pyrophosphatase [Bacteroidota bacterium]
MFIDELNKFRILLGSRSPRREQLLRDLGLRFEVVTKNWDEEYPHGLKAEEIALHVATQKAEVFRPEIKDNEIVITADTIVWCDGRILDKPTDPVDARRIIREISGNTHEVITAVCLLSRRKKVSFFSSTKVTFEKLSDEEIDYYISNFNPYDKAGAYGIQDWIGIAACSRIEGSYFNVMGLPVDQVYRELQKFLINSR